VEPRTTTFFGRSGIKRHQQGKLDKQAMLGWNTSLSGLIFEERVIVSAFAPCINYRVT